MKKCNLLVRNTNRFYSNIKDANEIIFKLVTKMKCLMIFQEFWLFLVIFRL